MISFETKRYRRGGAAVAAAMAACVLLQMPRPAAADGFYATGSMTEPSDGHTATLLESGKVLIVGAQFANLYDPATGQFTPTAGQPLYVDAWYGGGRFLHAAIRLQNGKVLIAGGGNIFSRLDMQPDLPAPYTVYAELYDPATDTFAPTGSMITERYDFQPVLLSDGRVLIAGGQGCCVAIPFAGGGALLSDSTLASAEIYDPATGTFDSIGDPGNPARLNAPRGQVNVAPLADGRFLFAGGLAYELSPTANGTDVFYRHHATADIYDPVEQTFTPIAPMAFARSGAATVSLPDGSVHLAYNGLEPVSGDWISTAQAERFDPVSQTFSKLNRPPVYGPYEENRDIRRGVVRLDSGRILLAGGLGFSGAASFSADLYDPATDTYARTQGDLVTPRISHTATKLADGRVLLAGGVCFDSAICPSVFLDGAEIYDPAFVSDPIFADEFEAEAPPLSATSVSGRFVRSTCPDVDAPYAHATSAHMFLAPDGRLCRTVELSRGR